MHPKQPMPHGSRMSGKCQLPTSCKRVGLLISTHLIRTGAAVAGYADPEAADFPVKLAPVYMGAD